MNNIIKYLEEFKRLKFIKLKNNNNDNNSNNNKLIIKCINKIETRVSRLWKSKNDKTFFKILSLFEDSFIYKGRWESLSENDVNIIISSLNMKNDREMFKILYNNNIKTFPDVNE